MNNPKFILHAHLSVTLVYNDKEELLQLMTHVFHKNSLFGIFLNKLKTLLFLKNINLDCVRDLDLNKENIDWFSFFCYDMNKDKIKDFIECLELACRIYEKVEGNWSIYIGPIYKIQTDEGRRELSKEDFLEWIG